ncbi:MULTISPECIES: hypothetical protein [unclassified Sphingomonas]|uniref:hypothetical protein n=1 Tax=unclassified Sphingomonas TaxID=196159 RepID=UPI0006FD3B10|nr:MULTISPECIES: hypothetical protein [unclassified Sphingomonas]KQX18435.1 hypothetical protein ASD17_14835 [Sphingomonas sp. Root1294]KQY72240.1 hypothetical protein ASD39_20140 [Sphingomonas sp. Root50]KRB94489.1 hypothetical protein ASE22_00610 [Sphingomonas sp. Root720]
MIPIDPVYRRARWLCGTSMSLRLAMDLWQGGAAAFGPSYDYYVDGVNGSDSNDGTSLAQAWKSLKKIGAISLPAAAVRSVLVKAGTPYDTADDWVERSNTTAGGNVGAGSILDITFEPGCVMDGSVANTSAAANAFEFASTDEATTRIFGNGLTIQHYNYDVGGASPNGIGNRGKSIVRAYDVHVVDCVDGYSAHGNAKMFVDRVTASGCAKSAYGHVENAHFEARRSTFTAKAGAILGIGAVASATSTAIVEDCILIPATSGQTLGVDGTVFTRCQIGTPSLGVTLTSGYGVGGTINQSFVNAYIDGHQKATLYQCYGKFSTRVRSGGAVHVTRSVISGPATGAPVASIIFSNFSGGSSKLIFNDNIVETATAAAFMDVNSTAAAALVSAASEIHNNVLSGSAAFDADLITADSGNTVRTGSFRADALIGAANTLDPDDYGYGPGSPAIGAATDGGNCGFAIGAVPPVAEAA